MSNMKEETNKSKDNKDRQVKRKQRKKSRRRNNAYYAGFMAGMKYNPGSVHFEETIPDERAKKWIESNRNRLLNSPTVFELEMYSILDILGVPYIKEYPIMVNERIFFADIMIPESKVVIEIDGSYHDGRFQYEKDEVRTMHIEGVGYKVVRFYNEEVQDRSFVYQELQDYLPKSISAWQVIRDDWE